MEVLPTTAYDFANGEMYVRFTEPVRGADVFIMQAHTTPINKAIMEQLIMIDAASVARLVDERERKTAQLSGPLFRHLDAARVRRDNRRVVERTRLRSTKRSWNSSS